jgi:hypothetical protein
MGPSPDREKVRFDFLSVTMTTASTGAVATPSTGTPATSVSLASFLPKESLKRDRFEGLPKDRKFTASWVRRCERIHALLGYADADWEKKLAFASASLPTTAASGRWYDSKVSSPADAFTDWNDFKTRFLVCYGPTTADLNTWEQEFQPMTQSNQAVSECVQSIDQARDVLASSDRVFEDLVVRQHFVAGVRSSVRQHFNLQLAVDNKLSYDRVVEIANSCMQTQTRGLVIYVCRECMVAPTLLQIRVSALGRILCLSQSDNAFHRGLRRCASPQSRRQMASSASSSQVAGRVVFRARNTPPTVVFEEFATLENSYFDDDLVYAVPPERHNPVPSSMSSTDFMPKTRASSQKAFIDSTPKPSDNPS